MKESQSRMNADIPDSRTWELHVIKDEMAAYENLEDKESCHQRQF